MKNIVVAIFAVILIMLISGCAHNVNKKVLNDNNPEIQKFSINNSGKDKNETATASSSNTSADPKTNNPIIVNPPDPDKSITIPKTNEIKERSIPVPVIIASIPENIEENDVDLNDTEEDNGSGKNTSPKKKSENIMDEALDYCQMAQELWQKGELDNAIESLDQAYSLILSVDSNDNSALAQQKEDIRFTISKRILEIYTSRNFAVNGNHKAIQMDMNGHIQAEINLFTTGAEKKFFRESLKRSGYFRTRILEMLKQAGLPSELSWLPLIESGFNARALSSARALGLWQFIPSTGYKFGLKRDLFVDERLDPVKSTEAAIAYLKELHQMFGDWSTVLAAYNCGEGRVLRLIRDQNLNYLDNFWDLYQRLPVETARYVPRFLATLHILSDPNKYGLEEIEIPSPLEYETVEITKQVHISDIAKELNTDEAILKYINPELRQGILPPYEYRFNVPAGKSEELLAKIESIPLSKAKPQASAAYHKVKRGESLSIIARRYRVSVQTLMRANKLKKTTVVAGKMLRIPTAGSSLPAPEAVKSTQQNRVKSGLTTSHIVKSGESLWIIANRYNTTVKNIQELNNLNNMDLHIGQVLYVQKRGYDNQNNDILKKHRVKSGENLFRISQKYNMPLDRLLHINKLTPKSKIHVGQYIFVE
ncbi:MAG: LysM peptidoglycan-binding domain-containing protein [Desulfobacteraceae bacterium]|nr:MAG: LysM peptidoglycan-binding domain-containing protein [Desulfobacteraceae bacterium]